MCRASGRRCPGAGGRSTQNTRQGVSRAKAALRKAKQTGDPDQVTAARDRLDAAWIAHQHAKRSATGHVTADQRGDVTGIPQPTTKDTGMGHQDHDTRGDDQDQPRDTGFTVHNTNIVSGNARVGSQHDVIGDPADVDADQVADVVATALRKAARARQSPRRTDQDRTRGTTNVASGDDVVAQQVGIQFGRTTVSADQRGDVTDHDQTHTTTHHTPHGTVTNTVHGRNHGIHTDVVHGPITINQPPRAGQHGDVTGNGGNPPPGATRHVTDTTRQGTHHTFYGPTNLNTGSGHQVVINHTETDQYTAHQVGFRIDTSHDSPAHRGDVTPPPDHDTTHSDSTTYRFGPNAKVRFTGPDTPTNLHIEHATSEIWVNGRRVQ